MSGDLADVPKLIPLNALRLKALQRLVIFLNYEKCKAVSARELKNVD
jgi:hypothetical protein